MVAKKPIDNLPTLNKKIDSLSKIQDDKWNKKD